MSTKALITTKQADDLWEMMTDEFSGELTELGCRLYWDLEVDKPHQMTVEFYESRVLPFIANFEQQKAERMAALKDSDDEEWIF